MLTVNFSPSLQDLQSLLPDSVFSVRDLIQARKLVLPMLMAVGKPLDDRSLVMEKLVELLQQLPLNSKTSEFVSARVGRVEEAYTTRADSLDVPSLARTQVHCHALARPAVSRAF